MRKMREPGDRTEEVKAAAGNVEIARNDFCDAFEQDPDRLFSNRECWYCKYGDFGGKLDSFTKRREIDPAIQAIKKRRKRQSEKETIKHYPDRVHGADSAADSGIWAMDYGIWVGTTKVTSDNANNVLNDSGTPTVTYDADTNTLTLNNANITSVTQPGTGTEQSGNASITGGIFKNSGDLNNVLHGTNTIGLSTNSSFAVAGIYTEGQLSIKGTLTDSLSVDSNFTTQYEAMGIWGNKGVTIDGCTVRATTGSSTGYDTIGIYAGNGSLSIKNAVVTGTGGSSAGASIGIGVDSGSLSIENSTVTANGGEGIEGSSYGITVTTTTITISASTVTAAGNTSALYFDGAPTVTALTATASEDKAGTDATAVTLDTSVYGPSNTYKYVQIAPVPVQWGVAGNRPCADGVSRKPAKRGDASNPDRDPHGLFCNRRCRWAGDCL